MHHGEVLCTRDRYESFLKLHPHYLDTLGLDRLRAKEFSRLDAEGHVYLDYTGGGLYSAQQIQQHAELLLMNTLGNPHSSNPTSQYSTALIEEARRYVLDYFNGGDDYFCVFTSNATAALKIVGECYPFGQDSHLLLSLDNHNSVNGIREFARHKGCSFSYVPMDVGTLRVNELELIEQLDAHPKCNNKLFAFPAQSNVSGIKHPLEYVEMAQDRGWDVVLDAAAFVPTNRLDLQEVKPDFVPVSFYKMFGYPTGIGCLLLRKRKFEMLVKPWYAGGTISLAGVRYPAHFLVHTHERFEDGTLNFLGIPALKFGLQMLESVGIDVIQKRVQSLTCWAIRNLEQLRHSSGRKLIKIFGSTDVRERGGTLVMNFYDSDGLLYPFSEIEARANALKISIRTGCFCNPGLDETAHEITTEELTRYFCSRTDGDFYDLVQFLGRLRGAVRVSLGLVSNFEDVETFLRFARSFLDKRLGPEWRMLGRSVEGKVCGEGD